MKKTLLALSFLFLFLISCGGNNDEDSKSKKDNSSEQVKKDEQKNKEEAKYKKAATDIVYELAVYLYEDGLSGKDNLNSKSKKSLDSLCTEYKKIKDINIRIDSIEKLLSKVPLKLDRSSSTINQFKNEILKSKSSNKIKSLVSEIKNELDPNPKDKPRADLYGKYLDFTTKINDIRDKVPVEKPKEKVFLTEPEIIKLKAKLNDGTFTKPSIPTWLYVSLAILFALLAAAIYFIKKIYDSLEQVKMKRESDKQKFNDLKYNHDRLNNKVAVIDINAVRNEMYEQMNVLAGRINDTQSEQVRNVGSAPQAKPEPKIFYAQYPDSADPVGFKNIQFESNSKMVYKITRIEGNKANYIIQNDENTQQYAIGNHAKILKPVCEYLNQPSSLNRTIKVFREGRLEMQNNIWIVVEKLKIRFE